MEWRTKGLWHRADCENGRILSIHEVHLVQAIVVYEWVVYAPVGQLGDDPQVARVAAGTEWSLEDAKRRAESYCETVGPGDLR